MCVLGGDQLKCLHMINIHYRLYHQQRESVCVCVCLGVVVSRHALRCEHNPLMASHSVHLFMELDRLLVVSQQVIRITKVTKGPALGLIVLQFSYNLQIGSINGQVCVCVCVCVCVSVCVCVCVCVGVCV